MNLCYGENSFVVSPPADSIDYRVEAIDVLKNHFADVGLCCAVNSLRDQLDDMKRKNQNSHISNEKNIHLQKQVSRSVLLCEMSEKVCQSLSCSQIEKC